jgi:dipeptidyl aminopeptidase/acylaminoacyl peptidase
LNQLITFCSDGQTIRANLDIPYSGAPCIIMSHGLEGSKDGGKWLGFVPRLISEGFACLRFNYRGCGIDKENSDGEFIDSTLTRRIRDYNSAIDFAQSLNINKNRIGVIGSSFGGTVAIVARDSRVKAMVTLSTPCRFNKPSNKESELYKDKGFHELPTGNRLLPAFFQDFSKYDICKAAGEIDCPLLIMHGGDDKLVATDNAYAIYRNSKQPKRLEIIKGASHSFSDPIHLKEVIYMTVDWFRQYL